MTRYPDLSEHELRTTLCRIAAEHQPDRAAMLHRIAQHRADAPVTERRPAGQALRLAGSALAVATILGVGGLARWALADGPDPGVVPVSPPIATRSAPMTTAPTSAPAPTPTSATATATATGTPATNRQRTAKPPARRLAPPPAKKPHSITERPGHIPLRAGEPPAAKYAYEMAAPHGGFP